MASALDIPPWPGLVHSIRIMHIYPLFNFNFIKISLFVYCHCVFIIRSLNHFPALRLYLRDRDMASTHVSSVSPEDKKTLHILL